MGVGGGEELLPPQESASFRIDAQQTLRRPSKFDPSRSISFGSRACDPVVVIGIIRRKALIKDLAAVYHAECLAYCQELLELQTKWEETYSQANPPEDTRKDTTRPTKRVKKA